MEAEKLESQMEKEEEEVDDGETQLRKSQKIGTTREKRRNKQQ